MYAQQSAVSRQPGRKNSGGTPPGAIPAGLAGPDAADENISTKSDRQGSSGQGGGTPSQRSIASGASGERRPAKSTGSVRRQRSGRGGRRSRAADRGPVGTVSPTTGGRRNTGASNDQAAMASSADGRGPGGLGRSDGVPPAQQVRGSPKSRERSLVGAGKNAEATGRGG